jgi:hypothetical protein
MEPRRALKYTHVWVPGAKLESLQITGERVDFSVVGIGYISYNLPKDPRECNFKTNVKGKGLEGNIGEMFIIAKCSRIS